MALDLNASATTPPPRSRKAAGARQAQQKAASTPMREARKEAVNGVFQLASFGLIIGKQYSDAGALNMHGDPIAEEVAKLAETNEGFAKNLDYLLEAGPYAGLITAVMPLALQIMANHGIIKAENVAGANVVPPQALESQVKTAIARQVIEAQRAQMEAEAEADQMTRQHAARMRERQMAAQARQEGSNGTGAPPETARTIDEQTQAAMGVHV